MASITSSIRKMTISPEKAAIRIIIAKPKQYIAAFNILLTAWIRANIRRIDRIDDMLLICDELLSYEMPPDFMVWYFNNSTIAKFNKFNMFRQQHGDKIKATAVIQQSHLLVPVATGATYRPNMSAIAAADAFGPPPAAGYGGRKKRTQHRRMRRTRIIRTRRHRAQNRKSRK